MIKRTGFVPSMDFASMYPGVVRAKEPNQEIVYYMDGRVWLDSLIPSEDRTVNLLHTPENYYHIDIKVTDFHIIRQESIIQKITDIETFVEKYAEYFI